MIYLEPANIVIITKQGPQTIDRLSLWVPGTEGHTHVDQGLHPVRPEQAEPPGNDGAPVMADQEDSVNTQIVKEANEVTNYVQGRVGGRGRWCVGVTEASEVRGYATVAQG